MLLKRCLIVILVLFLVWFLLYHIPLPWYVSRDMDGYRWDQAGNATPVSVHVRGWYIMRLWRDNTFTGYFSLSDGPDQESAEEYNWMKDYWRTGSNGTPIKYWDRLHSKEVGSFWERGAFRKIVGVSDDMCSRVAFPAETPEEAQALFDDVTSSNWGWPEPEE